MGQWRETRNLCAVLQTCAKGNRLAIKVPRSDGLAGERAQTSATSAVDARSCAESRAYRIHSDWQRSARVSVGERRLGPEKAHVSASLEKRLTQTIAAETDLPRRRRHAKNSVGQGTLSPTQSWFAKSEGS